MQVIHQLRDYAKPARRRLRGSELPAELEDAPNRLLARLAGVEPQTVRAWRSGRSQPQPRNAARLRQLAALVDGATGG